MPSDADEPHWAWHVEVPAPVIAQRRGEPVPRDGLEYLVGTMWLLIDGVRQGRVTYEVHDSLSMVQETPMWTMQEDDGARRKRWQHGRTGPSGCPRKTCPAYPFNGVMLVGGSPGSPGGWAFQGRRMAAGAWGLAGRLFWLRVGDQVAVAHGPDTCIGPFCQADARWIPAPSSLSLTLEAWSADPATATEAQREDRGLESLTSRPGGRPSPDPRNTLGTQRSRYIPLGARALRLARVRVLIPARVPQERQSWMANQRLNTVCRGDGSDGNLCNLRSRKTDRLAVAVVENDLFCS